MSILLLIAKFVTGIMKTSRRLVMGKKTQKKQKGVIGVLLKVLLKNLKRIAGGLVILMSFSFVLSFLVLGVNFLSGMTGSYDSDYEYDFDNLRKEQEGIIKTTDEENRDVIHEALYSRVSDLSYFQAFNNIDREMDTIEKIKGFWGKDAGKSFFYWLNWDDLKIKDANNITVTNLKPATGTQSKLEVEDGNNVFRDYYGREKEFLISQELLSELNIALFENYKEFTTETLKYPEAFTKPIHFIYDYNRVIPKENKGWNTVKSDKDIIEQNFKVQRTEKGKVDKNAPQPSKIVYDYAVKEYSDVKYHKELFSRNKSYFAVNNKYASEYLTEPKLSDKMLELEVRRGNATLNDDGTYNYDPPAIEDIDEEDLSEDDKIREDRAQGLHPDNAKPITDTPTVPTPSGTGQAGKMEEISAEEADEYRMKLIEEVKKLGHIKYNYGSKDPSTGYLDCSGFTTYVYKQIGVDIGAGTGAQMKKGREVKGENLAIGDLAITGSPGASGRHVIMYAGAGQWVHCGSKQGVSKHPKDTAWIVNKAFTIRRILPTDPSKLEDLDLKPSNGESTGEPGVGATMNPNSDNLRPIIRRDFGDDRNSKDEIVKIYYKLKDHIEYGQDVFDHNDVEGPFETIEDALANKPLQIVKESELNDIGDSVDKEYYKFKDGETLIPKEPNETPKRYYNRLPLTDEKGKLTAKSIPLINTTEATTKRLKYSYLNSEEYFDDLDRFVEDNKYEIDISLHYDSDFVSPIHGMDDARKQYAVQMFHEHILKNGVQDVQWEWSHDGSENYPIAETKWLSSKDANGFKNLTPNKHVLKSRNYMETVDSRNARPKNNDFGDFWKNKKEIILGLGENKETYKPDYYSGNTSLYWNKENNWPVSQTYRKDIPTEIESVRDWGLGAILVYLEERVVYFNTGISIDDVYNPAGAKSYFASRGMPMKDADKGWWPAEFGINDSSIIDNNLIDPSRVPLLEQYYEELLTPMKDDYPSLKRNKEILKVKTNRDSSGIADNVEEYGGDIIKVYESGQIFSGNNINFFGPTYKEGFFEKKVNKNAQFLNPIQYHLQWFDTATKQNKKIKNTAGEDELINQLDITLNNNKMTYQDPDVGDNLTLSKNKTIGGKRVAGQWATQIQKYEQEYLTQLNASGQNFDYLRPEWMEQVFVIENAITFAADFMMSYEKSIKRVEPLNERKVVDAFIGGLHYEIDSITLIEEKEEEIEEEIDENTNKPNNTTGESIDVNPDKLAPTKMVEVARKTVPTKIKVYDKNFGLFNKEEMSIEVAEQLISKYKGFDGKSGSNYGLGNYSSLKLPKERLPGATKVKINYKLNDKGHAFPLYRNYRGWKKKIFPRHIFTYINGEEFERWKARTNPVYKDSQEMQIILEENDEHFKYFEDYLTNFEANVPYNAKDEFSLKRDPSSKYKRIVPGEANGDGTFTQEYLQDFIAEGNKDYWKQVLKDLGIKDDQVSGESIGQILQGIAEFERDKVWDIMKGYHAENNKALKNSEDNQDEIKNMKPSDKKLNLFLANNKKESVDLTNVGIMSIPNLPIGKKNTISTNNIGKSVGQEVSLKIDGNTDERTDVKKSINYAGVKLAKLSKKYNSIPIGIYAYITNEQFIAEILDEIKDKQAGSTEPLTWKNPDSAIIKSAIEKVTGSSIPTNSEGKNIEKYFDAGNVTKILGFVKKSDDRENIANDQGMNNSSGITESGHPCELPSRSAPGARLQFKSFMGINKITNRSSVQWQIRNDPRTYTDSQGLARFRKGPTPNEQYDDYLVAMGSYYGNPGDRLKIQFESGHVITAKLGDQKSDRHTDSRHMYHRSDGSMIEFLHGGDLSKLHSMSRRMGDMSWLKYDWSEDGLFQGFITAIEKLTGDAPATGPVNATNMGRVTHADELKEEIDLLIGRDYQALRVEAAGSNGIKGSGVDYVVNHLPAKEVEPLLYKASFARREADLDPLGPDEYYDLLDVIGNPNSLFYEESTKDAEHLGGQGPSTGENLEEFREFIFNIDEYQAPLDSYDRISSRFGYRTHPIGGDWRLHGGIDIPRPSGTPIKAIAPGKVIYKGHMNGGGNTVMIAHPLDAAGEHHMISVHMHMVGPALVNVGQQVGAGTHIGGVGNTGGSTGAHLHFELRLVDPSFPQYKAPQAMIDKYGVKNSRAPGRIVMNPYAFIAINPTPEEIQYNVHDAKLQ